MPIYEFRCAKCGHIQEFLITSSSDPLELKCSECQGEDLERVLSQVSYAMGASSSSSQASSSPCATTRTCSPGNSCTTIQLPGHTR